MIKRLLAITLSLLLVMGAVTVAFAADAVSEDEVENAVRATELRAQTGIRTAFKAERLWNACDEADKLIMQLPAGKKKDELSQRIWIVRMMTMGYLVSSRPAVAEPEQPEEPVATQIVIEGPAEIVRPWWFGGVKKVEYTATVYDQFGNPMEDVTVLWELSPTSGKVLINSTGKVTVKAGANCRNYTITASAEEISATKTVVVRSILRR